MLKKTLTMLLAPLGSEMAARPKARRVSWAQS